MSALGNNPKASLDFFSQGAVTDGVSARQMYWIHDREWSSGHSLDGVSSLSQALLAATTDPSVLSPPDGGTAKQAARLASQTVNLLGHRTDIEHSDLAGKPTTAKNLATILSTYMQGVDELGWSGPGGLWNKGTAIDPKLVYFDGSQLNVPFFNPESTRSFIALAASSQGGFTTLRAGVDTFADRKYSLVLETLSNNPTNEAAQADFTNAYVTQAQLEGLFARAVGDSAIADAKKKNAASAAWVALGDDAVRVVPLDTFVTKVAGRDRAEAMVTFTINRARGAMADAASARWKALTGDEIDTQTELAKQAERRAAYRIMTTLATYPSALARPLPDSEWSPGGQLLSLNKMGGLGSSKWENAKTYLLSPDLGIGSLFGVADLSAFDLTYQTQFKAFYDK
jgi:hypothetical protein